MTPQLADGGQRSAANASDPARNLRWSKSKITLQQRAIRNRQTPHVIWLTGLSGSGKSTIGVELERELFNCGKQVVLLDGDNMRHGLCSDLSFSPDDRRENVRRVTEVAKLFADAGMVVITAFISPLRADREAARRRIGTQRFTEVFVNAPLEVCEQRDPKGLYAKARSGLIPEFTGISAPYESPERPEIELSTHLLTVRDCVAQVIQFLFR